MKKILFGYVFLIIVLTTLNAQNIEDGFQNFKSRLNEDPLRINGSISAMGQFYNAFGIDNRALPFSGRLSGTLNFDLLGIRMPTFIAISNGGVVFNKKLPSYNFIGISPEYKWAKIHLGTRTLDYGKYSFSNHSFQGVGFELTPGKWYVSSFYGRLRRARVQDFQGFQNIEPFFRRMGTGVKAGFEEGKDKVLISFFKAWDDETSLAIPDSALNFFAGENFISSIELSKSINKQISIEATASKSSFSENRTLASYTDKIRVSNYFGLFQRNASTRDNNAYEVKVNYTHRIGNFDIAYERIDPNFRTMGALFFNNDLENFTLGAKLKLFKSRWMIMSRGGWQKNNLDGSQANDYGRFIGSVNTNYKASDKLMLNAMFSSFNHVNRRSIINDPQSPVLYNELVLTNTNASAGFNYILSQNSINQSSVQGSYNYTLGITIENDFINFNQNTASHNAFITYMYSLLTSNWTFGVNSAYQKNSFGNAGTQYLNGGIMVRKQLLKNKFDVGVNTNFASTTQFVDQNRVGRGLLTNVIVSATWKLTDQSSLTFFSGHIRNQVFDSATDTQSFSELRTNMNYQYRFLTKRGK